MSDREMLRHALSRVRDIRQELVTVAVDLLDALDLIVVAARLTLHAEEEWLCWYPEFNDAACMVDHNPAGTRLPRKHTECGWHLVIPYRKESP